MYLPACFVHSARMWKQLIAGRIVQALGGSAGTVVATAIVKDLYSGREREKVMATIMSMVIIAPMVAPVLGALLLKYTSWRTIFLMLAAIGATALLRTMTFRETLSGKFNRLGNRLLVQTPGGLKKSRIFIPVADLLPGSGCPHGFSGLCFLYLY